MTLERPLVSTSLATLLAIAISAAPPQTAPAAGAGQDAPKPGVPEVVVPVFPNPTCPIMGKPISQKLYVDTDYGRIYVCCKGCNKKILADVPTAYKTAYPRTTRLENKVCPVSGKDVPAEAPTVLLQGRELALCCSEHAAPARESAQVVLAKAADPKLVDVGNESCPITAKPVEKNAFCVIDGRLVRLSSPACVEDARKDPRATLEKALQSRAAPKGSG